MRPELVLKGVIPANLMAFNADLEIDERNYRRHIRYLVDTPGVNRAHYQRPRLRGGDAHSRRAAAQPLHTA